MLKQKCSEHAGFRSKSWEVFGSRSLVHAGISYKAQPSAKLKLQQEPTLARYFKACSTAVVLMNSWLERKRPKAPGFFDKIQSEDTLGEQLVFSAPQLGRQHCPGVRANPGLRSPPALPGRSLAGPSSAGQAALACKWGTAGALLCRNDGTGPAKPAELRWSW